MKALLLAAAVVVGCGPRAAGLLDGGTLDLAQPHLGGASVAVNGDGSYVVGFARPAWTFSGALGTAASDIVGSDGSDTLGAYHDTSFTFGDRRGAIRAYADTPVVLFTVTLPGGGPNDAPLPSSLRPPANVPHHLSYQSKLFSPPSFDAVAPDSPLIAFDDDANAFVISPATHFTNAATTRAGDGTLASGIDPAIAMLPPGFAHAVILVAAPGINRTLDLWGAALLARSGKARPSSDATVDLQRLGYWTDNGAVYYYNFDAAKGYAGTLAAVRDQLQQLGLPLGYLQLDSWWYPKGATATWNGSGGIFQYVAEPTLFPSGLGAFQKSLGLPLVTHARWIDPSSPYRRQFAMSNNVITDEAYWTQTAQYLRQAGVVTYEQDWLDVQALPSTANLVDQDAFLDHMAAAMSQAGLSIQYCMPLPRHHLQSTKYGNVTTIRTAIDRFGRDRWHDHLYVSKLEAALGVWPWVDVFLSTEADNLLLATLSAGMVGVGDGLGGFDAGNLRKAARSDGVLVKPDAPLVPLDRSFVDEANATGRPLVAATYSDFAELRASYVFAFGAGNASFAPADLGQSSTVIVYDVAAGKAVQAAPGARLDLALAAGRGYFVVVPVGRRGRALLGDAGKLVPLGKQRVTALADDGSGLHAELVFARGEGAATLRVWSLVRPSVIAGHGSVANLRGEPGDGNLWLVDVTPAADGSAAITID